MLKFNENKYLEIGNNTVKLKGRIDEIVSEVSGKGYKNIFLIGSGGSYAMFIPFEYFLSTKSTIPAYVMIAKELMVSGHNQLSSESVCIFTSTSGTTEETVAAAEYCKSKGATTICISGKADVPFVQHADYAILNTMDDFSASDADYLVLYMLTFSFMHHHGEFPNYEDFCKNLRNYQMHW